MKFWQCLASSTWLTRTPLWGWMLAGVLVGSAAGAAAQVTFAGTQFSVGAGQLAAPNAVAVDGVGNLYIADTGNNRVVEVKPLRTGFTTPAVILSGLSSPAGVAADWSGNVFVSDTGNGRILKLAAGASGFGTPVVIASNLNSPAGLAVDSIDDVYVANSGSGTVLQVPAAGGGYLAPAVIGSGYSHPMGVAVDAGRDVYVADTGNNQIVEEPFSPSGYATHKTMWTAIPSPMGLGIDKSGDLYIAVNGGQEVLEKAWAAGANRFGGTLTIGTGLISPAGVGISETGQVLIADVGANQVLSVQATSLQFGTTAVGAPGVSLTYNFNIAAGTTVSGVGILTQGVSGRDFADGGASTCTSQAYAAATSCGVNVSFHPLAPGARNGAVVLWGASGGALSTCFFSGVGAMPKLGFLPGTVTQLGSQLSAPAGVAVDGAGNVFISDSGNNRVVELPWTGSGYGAETVLPVNGLINPMGMAIDGAGNLYIVSNGNDKVIELPSTPLGFGPQLKVGSALYGPSNVAVGANGQVLISDTLDQRVDDVQWTGSGFAQESNVGNHKAPVGVAVDSAGNVYFTDPYQNIVSKLPWGGTHFLNQVSLPVRGTSFPSAVAVDTNGDLFVLDSVSNQLVMLPWNGSSYGSQMTVASGFNAPSGVAVDSNGAIYVADTGNNQVVKIDMSIPGGMSYAATYLGSTSADSPQATMVGNLGNLPVTLDGISFPTDFPEGAPGAGGCAESVMLAGSEWCELAVDFVPSSASSLLTEAVILTDDSGGVAGTQQSIAVSGSGLAKASQSISFAGPANVVYGAAPVALAASASSSLPVTFSVISGPGVLSSNGKMLSFSGVGTVVLQAAQSGNSAFSAAPPVTVSVPVAPAVLTVTPRNAVATYGAIPATYTYLVTGFVNGDSSSVVSGKPAIVGPSSQSIGVGTYPLQASQGSLSSANYVFVFATGTLTVNPALLQVHAVSQSVTYGKAPSPLQWNMNGFVNGDKAGVVSGSPLLTTAVTIGSGAGTYAIVASSGSLWAANYKFVCYGASLVVNRASLTVTAATQTIVYGASLPSLSYSISGFVNGDEAGTAVRGKPALAIQVSGRPPAGRYMVSASVGTLSAANYSFTFAAGAVVVQKAVLQVVAENASMTYGGNLPTFSYHITGFVNGDTAASALSGAPGFSTTANSRSVPGSFTINASPGSLSAKNYSFAFGGGVLTVNKAVLTVSPKAATMTYGGQMPASVLSYSGFVNGDNVSSISGAPSLVTRAAVSASVGSYPVLISAGSLSSAKYSFQLQSGTLTITPAVLTVTPVAASMTYGAPLPKFTYAFSGLVNGDSASAAVSGAPQLVTAATSTSSAGSYAVTAALGTLSARNYSFAFKSATLTVNKALLTVTAANVSMTAGGTLPTLTYSITGFAGSDTQASATNGKPSLTTSATSSSKAGSYPIVAALGNLSADNYTFAFVNGKLTVNQ